MAKREKREKEPTPIKAPEGAREVEGGAQVARTHEIPAEQMVRKIGLMTLEIDWLRGELLQRNDVIKSLTDERIASSKEGKEEEKE